MKLTYIGHACFLVETDAGVRILLDPYQPGAFGGKIGLKPFTGRVDIIASTHEHIDHFHVDPRFGRPAVIRATGTACGVDFTGIPLPHDAECGRVRGMVTGFRFEVDGIAVFHPGDVGCPLTPEQLSKVGHVDVLLLPVGGTFTIGPRDAVQVMKALAPAVTIPMHFRNSAVTLPLAPVDDFLGIAGGAIERVEMQPVVFSRQTFPPVPTVMVLTPTHL